MMYLFYDCSKEISIRKQLNESPIKEECWMYHSFWNQWYRGAPTNHIRVVAESNVPKELRAKLLLLL